MISSRASPPPPTSRHRLVRHHRHAGRPGKIVAVVGNGAVGLLGVLAAKQLGAERIIAMSRHGPQHRHRALAATVLLIMVTACPP